MEIAIVLNSPTPIKNVEEKAVIYADRGYVNKKYLKDKITLGVVGDFDTLGAPPEGENLILLDKEKNFTDGERAVLFAKESGADKVSIYGADGGKIDHVLGNIFLLKSAAKLNLKAEIRGENYKMTLIGAGENIFVSQKGATVSVIPFGGSTEFVKSEGLYYPLDNLTIAPDCTRGISNVAANDKFKIKIKRGEALLIIYNK